jgi:hypothetical protein
VGGGVQTGSNQHVGHLLAYCTCPGWLWGWRIWWNEWQGKPKYSEKASPGDTLSTTNSTWPDPELKPSRRGGKPATNRFSYGAAHYLCLPECLEIRLYEEVPSFGNYFWCRSIARQGNGNLITLESFQTSCKSSRAQFSSSSSCVHGFYFFARSPTKGNVVPLDNLIAARHIKKCPPLYEPQRFIILFTTTH